MCESQHLQARRIQRLNSKFILVRIRNTDHVLRVRWEEMRSKSHDQNMAMMVCGVREREGQQWVGEMVCYNVQWIRLEGSSYSQQQRAALTISRGKLQQQGGPHVTVATSPISIVSSCSKNFYSIKPSFSWNEKQKAQWFSTHSCL